jgi:hypothetical protein
MNNMPPSYIPPGPPVRRGPSCWLIGGLTCLGIVVLVIIAVIVMTVAFTHSPAGKKFTSGFGSAVREGTVAGMCRKNMQTIQGAIVRYHDHTGHYPSQLTDLLPDYLTDRAILHCSLDTNPDPDHVSYVYSKPTASTASNAPLLTLHWQMNMEMMGTSQTLDETEIVTLAGNPTHQQSQSTVTTAPAGG